ncbi:MAG: ABC transporter permease [Deltaproteobacteria bacterium]|nr:ABC transporter permease [Deltaproteobacteria bacterium]MBW2395755.1 ABC transporter permease [Deltaproteobacteria bacterium]
MQGPNLFALAWRNLWRQRRRTFLTLSSIALGMFFAWMFTGLGDANWRQMIDLAARMGGGHVTLQHAEYLESPTLSRSVPDAGQLAGLAADDPDVKRVVMRISGNMILASAARSQGAAFIAFDARDEDQDTLSVLEAIEVGEPWAEGQRGAIVLGAKLAERLRVGVGNKVVYTLTDKHGEIVQEAVRVSGLLRTGAPTVDSRLALLPIEDVRTALGYSDEEAGQVAVFLRDQRAADRVAARLGDRIATQNQTEVSAIPWHRLQPELAGFIAMKVGGTWVMEVIIMLLVAAGIFNTIFVSVMERMREFGILRAIGWSPGQLGRLVMAESAWLAAAGMVGAVLVTAWPYWYLNTVGVDLMAAAGVGADAEVAGIAMTSMMYVDIYPENALLIAMACVLATLLAGIYPAWKAGHVDPAETIRLV